MSSATEVATVDAGPACATLVAVTETAAAGLVAVALIVAGAAMTPETALNGTEAALRAVAGAAWASAAALTAGNGLVAVANVVAGRAKVFTAALLPVPVSGAAGKPCVAMSDPAEFAVTVAALATPVKSALTAIRTHS